MLSAAMLAAMQATANASLDVSVTIKRNTAGVSDGAGGSSEVDTTIATVNGNLAQPSGQLMQNYDYLIGTTTTWMVRLPVGTNVLENDILLVGSLKLRVQAILQPQSYQTSLRLLAAEVQ